MNVQSEVRLLCEYAKMASHLQLGFTCTLDAGVCFFADDPVLREKCPTKRLKGTQKEVS